MKSVLTGTNHIVLLQSDQHRRKGGAQSIKRQTDRQADRQTDRYKLCKNINKTT